MPIWTQRQSWMPCLRAGIGQVGLPLQEHHELARCRESPCRYRQVRFALVQLLNRTPQVGERRLASAPAAPARLTQPARGVGTSDSLIAGVYRALSCAVVHVGRVPSTVEQPRRPVCQHHCRCPCFECPGAVFCSTPPRCDDQEPSHNTYHAPRAHTDIYASCCCCLPFLLLLPSIQVTPWRRISS